MTKRKSAHLFCFFLVTGTKLRSAENITESFEMKQKIGEIKNHKNCPITIKLEKKSGKNPRK